MDIFRRLLFRLRRGAPRPCGDPRCVLANPELHGLDTEALRAYRLNRKSTE